MSEIAIEAIEPVERVERSGASTSTALAERLSALRRRTRFTVTDRMLLTVGSILMPLGVVFVLLAWYGAAHTTRVFEQIPYMISGGFLGVGLVVAGGFCYFGYFIARLLSTSREMLDSLLRLEDRLEAAEAKLGELGDVAVTPAGRRGGRLRAPGRDASSTA